MILMVKDPRSPKLSPAMSSQGPVLVLMLKHAVPGYGKQRLAHEIGQESTLCVATALLDCALEDAAAWSGDIVFAISRMSERPWAENLVEQFGRQEKDVQILSQCAGNLGVRLRDLDHQLRTSAERKILLMAGDAPGLEPSHFQQSLDALDDFDVSLVNSSDGGTDLMGSRSGWPAMSDLPWGESGLATALTDRCESKLLKVCRLDGSFDIDTAGDLEYAASRLTGDDRPARRRLLEALGNLRL